MVSIPSRNLTDAIEIVIFGIVRYSYDCILYGKLLIAYLYEICHTIIDC